jgi:hypothetical protein
MTKILSLAALLAVVACPAVNAATVSFTTNGEATSFYLDGAEDNDQFDTIFFKAVPNAPAAFTNPGSGNVAGLPRPAGDAFTYYNRKLDADPLDVPGALGLSPFGLINTAQELSVTVADLGGTINTSTEPGGRLFLANVNMPGSANFSANGTATVQLLRLGALVEEHIVPFPIPEPATLAMAGLGLVGIVAASRRKA